MPTIVAVILAAAVTAATFEAKVIGVVDADTIDVLDEAKATHRIRNHGIDSPERGQPFAKKSRAAMAALVAGKAVTVERLGDDRYGRLIARIIADDRDVGEAMIAGGWAWHYVARMKWRAMNRIRLETAEGEPHEVLTEDLSEADLQWLEKVARTPADMNFGRERVNAATSAD